MKNRNIAVGFTLASFVVLFPGIFLPMLTITLRGDVRASVGTFGMNILNKENSILQTVSELFQNDNVFVACMIFFFSVMVPVIKGLLLLYGTYCKDLAIQSKVFKFVKSIGKWSMADVMVVGVFLAYLSTRSQPSQSHHRTEIMVFPVDIKVLLGLDSHLGSGFYFFFAYCMLSLIGLHFFKSTEDAQA
ncbi:MAG: paraquat-inducible protein A [Oligoflexales bacterium]|nr:paraquat-inducible protein A [Oligoflexales bacterium]